MSESPEREIMIWYFGAPSKLLPILLYKFTRQGRDSQRRSFAWLCTQVPVHAMEMPGRRYDIGDINSYQEVQDSYHGIVN